MHEGRLVGRAVREQARDRHGRAEQVERRAPEEAEPGVIEGDEVGVMVVDAIRANRPDLEPAD
jgi:hypothetical protein